MPNRTRRTRPELLLPSEPIRTTAELLAAAISDYEDSQAEVLITTGELRTAIQRYLTALVRELGGPFVARKLNITSNHLSGLKRGWSAGSAEWAKNSLLKKFQRYAEPLPGFPSERTISASKGFHRQDSARPNKKGKQLGDPNPTPFLHRTLR